MKPPEPIFGANAFAVLTQLIIIVTLYYFAHEPLWHVSDWLVCELTGLCSVPAEFHLR